MPASSREKAFLSLLTKWLKSCTRRNKISRNTVAVGIVVLHSLKQKCPLSRKDIITSGGEVMGSRGNRLREILGTYGIPSKFLKEATTRQAHQDGQKLLEALGYGEALSGLDPSKRVQVVDRLISELVRHADIWLGRQHLRVACNRQLSPLSWIKAILREAKGKSGGKVEQHLVGAKLQTRHPEVQVANFPSHAGDAQTQRQADFLVGTTAYHVTAAPGPDVIGKCKTNIDSGLHPVLLVPRDQIERCTGLAQGLGIENQVTINAIEEFVSMNIIELSTGESTNFIETLKKIIDTYNLRLEEVETDLSLKIEIQ